MGGLFVVTQASRSVAATSHAREGLGVGVRPARRRSRVRQSGRLRIYTVNIAQILFWLHARTVFPYLGNTVLCIQPAPIVTSFLCVFVPVWFEVVTYCQSQVNVETDTLSGV